MTYETSPGRRANMRAIRSRDTNPELAVRSAVHSLGLRFRVAARPAGLGNTADLVLSAARVAVFVDGCFWHGCPDHGHRPRNNESYWSGKLAQNKQRDRRIDERLRELGWTPLRFWAHEDPRAVAAIIQREVQAKATAAGKLVR
jgi:DNA mismatch endonuclease (patch repair protein)